MQSNAARAVIGVGAVAVIVVLFIVLSGGSDDNKSSTQATSPARTTQTGTGGTDATKAPARPKPPTIVVKGAKPVGGVKKIEFTKGEPVRFVVRSDVADEIHVHGYDLMKDVPAGGHVSFSFPAKIEGIFEVELEGRKEQIAELRVNP